MPFEICVKLRTFASLKLRGTNVPTRLALLERQLVVDDPLERLERLSAAEHPTVDEERRCPVDPGFVAGADVRLDERDVLVRVHARVEARGIEAQVHRVLFEVVDAEPLLVGEQPIVVRPELALLVGALARLGCRPGVRMVGERILAVDEPDPIAVGV